MSKSYDAAFATLDSAAERAFGNELRSEPLTHHRGRCWRCGNKNGHKVEDFTCEGCFAYINEETDEDPVKFIPPEVRRGWPNS